MRAVATWFRLDLRLRWRSLAILALLVAIAAGTVMTAVAGAQRGETAVDRLMSRTLPATVAALPNLPGFDWDAVRELPEVEALSTFVLTGTYEVEGFDEYPFVENFPPGDAGTMHTLERPVVLEGRRADVTRADEVVVTKAFADTFGRGVGDHVTLRLYAPETADAMMFAAATPEPDGPTIEATIVGIVRSPWFHDAPGETGWVVPSAGLSAQYPGSILGTQGQAVHNALVRLKNGAADIPAFKAGLEQVSGHSDIDLMNLVEEAASAEEVTSFEANALRMFAAAAALAAVFLVGQTVARYVTAAAGELQVLRTVGLTPRQSATASAIGPTLAAVAGVVVGAAGAAVASRWFPIGSAAGVEPQPGIDVNVPITVVGVFATPVVIACAAVMVARALARSERSGARLRRSAVAGTMTRAGAPVPVVVGTQFALEPGRGRTAVPVRPALLGSVVGVVGVVAAFTLSAGVEDAAGTPGRFGQVHQLEGFVGFSGEDPGPADAIIPVVAADHDVAVVNDTMVAVATADNVPVTLYSLDHEGTPWRPVVTEGRVPHNPDEVALAPNSARDLGVEVGDVVSMTGTAEARELTVTGIAFVPEGHNNYVTGGWVTRPGYDGLFGSDDPTVPVEFKYHVILVGLRSDADPAVVTARLEEALTPVLAAAATAMGEDPSAVSAEGILAPPEQPSNLQEVRQIRTLPVFLAAFLAVLALGAVGHALATSVRRRGHDVAVLRALGMTGRQSRGLVGTQATVLALVGLGVGLPLGIALGRTVWRYVADTTPLLYVAPLAALGVALVVPVTLIAANLLAAWPSHRAATLRVGDVLRAE